MCHVTRKHSSTGWGRQKVGAARQRVSSFIGVPTAASKSSSSSSTLLGQQPAGPARVSIPPTHTRTPTPCCHNLLQAQQGRDAGQGKQCALAEVATGYIVIVIVIVHLCQRNHPSCHPTPPYPHPPPHAHEHIATHHPPLPPHPCTPPLQAERGRHSEQGEQCALRAVV